MQRLKGKTIFIGREEGQGRLLIAVDDKLAIIGQPHSVPTTVSKYIINEVRAHAKITIDQNLNMVLTNLSNQDVTYVNGDKIESKDIVQSDIVELGENKFNINLANIINTAIQLVPQSSISTPPPTVNIKHLEAVYNDYHSKEIARQKKLKSVGILASCSLIFTLGSTAIATLANQLRLENIMEYLWILPVLGFIVMLISLYKRITDNSIQDADSAAKKFQEEYVCPNCGRFLGNMSYDLLKSQYAMQCPHCRSKFVD